jgi:hypothetical protein
MNRFSYMGVYVTSSAFVTLTSITAQNSGNAGVFVAFGSAYVTITGGKFEGNGTGINVQGDYSTITSNVSQANSNGFSITGTGNTASGNTSQGNSSNGFSVGGTSNTFNGNMIRGNSTGISMNAGAGTQIVGNTIDANTTYGLYAISINNTVVSSNKFADNGSTTNNNAIFLSNADSFSITNNIITDSQAGTTNYAINISDSTSDTNYLADNTLGGGSINDAGTGTVYAGQQNASGYFGFKARWWQCFYATKCLRQLWRFAHYQPRCYRWRHQDPRCSYDCRRQLVLGFQQRRHYSVPRSYDKWYRSRRQHYCYRYLQRQHIYFECTDI